MGKIVFSAIGTTDPVRDEHDGGWIHCLRWVLPEKTVIYLSASMTENEETDHRYSNALALLNEDLKKQGLGPIQIEIEKRPHLHNPHEYGNLYADIKRVLVRIHKENPEADIYINCSSGTPAMKNCLADMRMLLPFGDKMYLLQVADPLKGERNNDGRVRKDYDYKLNWDCNEDRLPDSKKRVKPLAPDQHDKMVTLIDAKNLIRQHEYEAAKRLFNEKNVLENVQSGRKIMSALEGAALRHMMRLPEAGAKLKQANILCDKIQAEADQTTRKCAEMILLMEQDMHKKHYADMLVKFTPVFFNLCAEYILLEAGWNPTSYENSEGIANWDKLLADHPDFKRNDSSEKKDPFLKSKDLVYYISKLKVSKEDYQLIKELRDVEFAARNKAAHTLAGIDSTWIVNHTGKQPSYILKQLKNLFRLVAPEYKNEIWESYTRMDNKICDLIDAVDLLESQTDES